MEHDKSIEYSEKDESNNNAICSKAYKTRSVIKNKYAKARMDRLEHEQEVARTIKPIIDNSNTVASASHLSYNSTAEQSIFSVPSQMNQSKTVRKNVNELCARLRLLLSTTFASNDNHTPEIKMILNELHTHNIIV